MSQLIELIQEADLALLEIEQGRVAMDAAKVAFEMAKSDHERAKRTFEEVIARADEVGVSRVKLRKIVEERAAVLSASGLMSIPVNKLAAQKAPNGEKRESKRRAKKDMEPVQENAEAAGPALNS